MLEYPPDAEFSGSAGGDEERVLITATAGVSRQTVETGGFNGVADYSMAGDYCVAVSMSREDFSVEFPFTIELEILGEPQSGPTYADGATWTVADGATVPEGSDELSSSTGQSPDAEPGEQPDASDSDDRSTAPLAVIIVGIAAALAALVLWRRRS